MRFEWDEKKARSNKAKHGVDFESVWDFDFDTALYAVEETIPYGEERFQAIGLIGFRVYMLVFTERGDLIRVISFRKAPSAEMRDFYER
jgi:uncharacterized DUF497 family protein